MSQDFRDLLREFVDVEVRFLVVGAYAPAIHGRPRATGDLDLPVDPTPADAERVYRSLQRFCAPLVDLTPADLAWCIGPESTPGGSTSSPPSTGGVFSEA